MKNIPHCTNCKGTAKPSHSYAKKGMNSGSHNPLAVDTTLFGILTWPPATPRPSWVAHGISIAQGLYILRGEGTHDSDVSQRFLCSFCSTRLCILVLTGDTFHQLLLTVADSNEEEASNHKTASESPTHSKVEHHTARDDSLHEVVQHLRKSGSSCV